MTSVFAMGMLFSGFVIGFCFAEFRRKQSLAKREKETQQQPDQPLRVARVLFGAGTDTIIELADGRSFRGGCTVWRAYPSGDRAPIDTALWLSDREKEYNWLYKSGDYSPKEK